jgi:hypothetical protein
MQFKIAIIRRWGDQVTCARETGVSQGSLSQLQRNYREPYPSELAKLRAYFSENQLRRFFGSVVTEKLSRAQVEDEEQRNVGT